MTKILLLLLFCTTAFGQIKIGYKLENTNVAKSEPVILNFSIINHSPMRVTADLGPNRNEAFLISLTFPDGKMLTLKPHSDSSIVFLGQISVDPDKNFSESLILNQWFDFSELGAYQIRSVLTTPIKTKTGSLRVDEFYGTLQIGPRDSKKLADTCEKLTQGALETNDYDTARQAAQAISTVRDPIVIPYLARLMNASAPIQPIVISALQNFENVDAINVLGDGLESQSKVSARLSRIALLHIANTAQNLTIRTTAETVLNRKR